jgi:hypothetical protein
MRPVINGRIWSGVNRMSLDGMVWLDLGDWMTRPDKGSVQSASREVIQSARLDQTCTIDVTGFSVRPVRSLVHYQYQVCDSTVGLVVTYQRRPDPGSRVRSDRRGGSSRCRKCPPKGPTAIFAWGPICTPMASHLRCVRTQGIVIWVETQS